MSTRSNLIIKNKDNTYTCTYIHFDGYIFGGVGEDLLLKISTEKQARQLVRHGSRKSLFAKITYKDMDSTWNVNTLDEILKDGTNGGQLFGIEYFYLFQDGKWFVACYETDLKFVGLRDFYLANISTYIDDSSKKYIENWGPKVMFYDDNK